MKLTDHFSLEEFACRCGCGAETDWIEGCRRTAEILEVLRELINSKEEYHQYRNSLPDGSLKELSVTLDCGVRCPKHNAEVGGAPKSKHLSTMYEGAADTWIPGLPAEQWYAETKGYFRGRILYLDKNFVHVDRRAGNTYYSIVGQSKEEA